MKSPTIRTFMQKSLYVGIVFALAVIAFDVNVFQDSNVRLAMSYASAETLASSVSTTTLIAAEEKDWRASLPVADSAEEVAAPSIASPTLRAAAERTITAKKAAPPPAEKPARIIIPSIGLDTTIVPVGVNDKGEMDVPSGSTKNVGWFKGGPMPGQKGSSVLDAHVFAAFEDLRYLKVGEQIIVETVNGTRLAFTVQESTVYKLSEIRPEMLFGRNDGRRLNLITCAGSPVGDTYSHRLVVYATFSEVQ